jgi:hypothetical protein
MWWRRPRAVSKYHRNMVRYFIRKERNRMSGLITGLVLLALGALAAASSIVARRPDAKAYIELMIPYQGWFGFITCLSGAWIIINAIINLNWFSYVPVWWLTYLATGLLIASLGLLLGYALLTKHIFNHSAKAAQRASRFALPLSPIRLPAQPVDATQALNRSAGVSNCKVSRGRSFS